MHVDDISAAVILALAGGVGSSCALGQDSVSNTATPGLPGDAVSIFTTTEQVNDYVVDLAEKTSSWGGRFRIGPVVKSSASSSTLYFNHLIGAQAASGVWSSPGVLPRSSYGLWNAAGRGINASRNLAPTTTLSLPALRARTMGLAFMEFAAGPDNLWGTGDDENGIIGASIALAPRYTDRVYVSRVAAASSKASATNANAALGLGGIDSAGNIHLLGDGTGLSGPSNFTNKKLIRINTGARNAGLVNVLNATAGADAAATTYFPGTLVTQTTPTMIPSSLAGRAVMANLDFAGRYQFEGAAGVMSTSTNHLGAGVVSRGSASFVPQVFAPLGSGDRAGMMGALSIGPSSAKVRGISVWSVTASGLPSGTARFEMPTTSGFMFDRHDGFDPSSAFGSLENQEFTNFQSQTAYRGANGPVAMAVLPGGDLLVAATVTSVGGGAKVPAGVSNSIAVARVSSADQSVTWTIAAHTGNANGSAGGAKAILGDFGADGRPGTGDAGEGDGVVDSASIGSLANASESESFTGSGPSISPPMMDRAGNVYFISHIAMNPMTGSLRSRKSVGLVRANFNPQTNAYKLELITEIGDVIAGLNSVKNYQIQYLGVSDADSVDSGTTWSGNMVNEPLAGVDMASLAYGSPLSLGGLVLRVKVVYDTNGDGQFIDPSVPGNTGTDEAYNAAMLILPRVAASDVGRQGGASGADGLFDNNDFVAFIDAFFAGALDVADVGGQGGLPQPDGQLDNNDFVVFVDRFFNQS